MNDAVLEMKKQAGFAAADEEVQSGMVIGLGTGTTAIWFVRRLAERVNVGDLRDVVGIPTSTRTEAEAVKLGFPLTTLTEHPVIDVTVDGADEIDPQLRMIKGGGGALLREKIVAEASKRMVVVASASKLVTTLGAFPLPLEVIPFGHATIARFLVDLGVDPVLRTTASGEPYQTDSGNYIYDCAFGTISDPEALAHQLDARAGIVEHGLFIGIANEAVIGDADGVRRVNAN